MIAPADNHEQSPDVAASSDEHVLAECVRLLYVRSAPILTLMGVAAAVFALSFAEDALSTRVLGWLAGIAVTTVARLLLARRYLSRPRSSAEAPRWARLYAVGAGSSGVAWGVAGLLFFRGGLLSDHAFLAMMLGGVAGSAIAANSIYVRAALAFAVPALTPFVVRLVAELDAPHVGLAMVVVLFAGAMATVGRTAAQAIYESVRLRFGNEALAEHYRREVVQHRSAAQALRESEALFRDLSERAIVGVYVIQDGRFRYVNPKMGEFFGYAPGEMLGVLAADTVHPDDRATMTENVRKRLASEVDAIHYEFRGLRKSGEIFDLEVFGTRTSVGGRPAIVGTLVDVTNRKRAEQEQIRVQKVESLGILAGGIAHDFNNLLAAILGSITVAKESGSVDALQREVLGEAQEAALRASDLTRQLLTFSRGGEPVKKSVSLESVVRSSAAFAVRGSRAVCHCEFAPDLWAVDADEGQIAQVMHNLVLNAVQAMPDGGAVRVVAANVPQGTPVPVGLAPSRYVRISVTDDGPGISPAIMQKIFDPYFTTKSTGTGLGLATAHSIVRRHRGHISVDPQSTRGATFHVHLPAAERVVGADVDVAAPQLAVPRGRIAVMDDDDLVRRSAMRVLTQLGFEAVPARDGAELLAVCEAARASGRPIDAAIMDLTIPGGMGGKEAVGVLRQREPAVKAIVSSGYSTDPVMADHARHGFAGMIAKPYCLDGMAAVLQRVLGGNRSTVPSVPGS
ncbi:MAG TPA: PAS domain S-box protein [Anaeromyxobacteraceae bacterium]|nr:PAS domain S-box protein [Anaeromyxobacteraceae bacterium]